MESYKDFISVLETIFELQKRYSNDEILDTINKTSKVADKSNVNIKELVSFMLYASWCNS
jgi:chromosome condensin MukBEF complex kleisin-like MukF subunit